jgi:UDP-N-acetylmuramate dehydrogenase
VTTTEQVYLAQFTTLRLGGPAARVVVAGTQDDLIEAVASADREDRKSVV